MRVGLEDVPELAVEGVRSVVGRALVTDSVDCDDDDGFVISSAELEVTPQAGATGFFPFAVNSACPPASNGCDCAARLVCLGGQGGAV